MTENEELAEIARVDAAVAALREEDFHARHEGMLFEVFAGARATSRTLAAMRDGICERAHTGSRDHNGRDVALVEDPYEADVNNTKGTMIFVCDGCLAGIAADI